MTDEKFREHVKALSSKLLEKPKTMMSQHNMWWRELCNTSYIFDRRERANAQVVSFSKDDVLELYVEYTCVCVGVCMWVPASVSVAVRLCVCVNRRLLVGVTVRRNQGRGSHASGQCSIRRYL